jgi:6-phosphogluconate dehydrogenase
MNTAQEQEAEIGMVGLGVMGRNLLLNMADHGIAVAGYDKDAAKVAALRQESKEGDTRGAEDVREIIGMLRAPRMVMMLVPAGASVDAVIMDLLPWLSKGDMIIDGGNSHFSDTDLRARTLAERGITFLGVGVSGGEHGARHGPSIMPSGPADAYRRVQPIFEAIAAHVDSEPGVTWLGPGSAGHYVKMVHNGIEYALMQLIAEYYDLMKRGVCLTDDELGGVYDRWNKGELNSYLVEITGQIFRRVDAKTDPPLIDVILDEARQKGTGMWMSQDAMDLQVPVPTFEVAFAMRNLSAYKSEREAFSKRFARKVPGFSGNREAFLTMVRDALYAGAIFAYAEGMAQIGKASQVYAYHLHLESVARIWRGGCIIRAMLLEPVRAAFRAKPDLPNLLLDLALGGAVMARQQSLRAVVCSAVEWGIAAPGLSGRSVTSMPTEGNGALPTWCRPRESTLAPTPTIGSTPRGRFTRNGRRGRNGGHDECCQTSS